MEELLAPARPVRGSTGVKAACHESEVVRTSAGVSAYKVLDYGDGYRSKRTPKKKTNCSFSPTSGAGGLSRSRRLSPKANEIYALCTILKGITPPI
ncbi:hypothetical protein RB195_000785 [Necator americanus]|uniref:Protein kinase domain-containing protein n=1 Tax=Necator americanus TaxID=51031 RepID=A0ABR1DBC7_NECAM